MYQGQFRVEANPAWDPLNPHAIPSTSSFPRHHTPPREFTPWQYSPNFTPSSSLKSYAFPGSRVPDIKHDLRSNTPPPDSRTENLQRQLMHGLQEVSEQARRADRISKEALDARTEAENATSKARSEIAELRFLKAQQSKEELSPKGRADIGAIRGQERSDRRMHDDFLDQIAKLQRRIRDLEAENKKSQNSAAHHRSLYREEVNAKEIAETRAKRAEDSKNVVDNRLQIMGEERSAMMADRVVHDDLLDKMTQLQRRNQTLEREHAQSHKSASHHRNLYEEEVVAKDAVEAKLKRAQDAKNVLENHLRTLEMERSTMMTDHKRSHDDLLNQIAQHQRRNQDLESEHMQSQQSALHHVGLCRQELREQLNAKEDAETKAKMAEDSKNMLENHLQIQGRERSSDRRIHDDLLDQIAVLQLRIQDLEEAHGLSQKSLSHHRNLYREELEAKEAAETRAQRAEDAKYMVDTRLKMIEMERSTDRSMHDDLSDQVAQLRRRNQDLEAEHMQSHHSVSYQCSLYREELSHELSAKEAAERRARTAEDSKHALQNRLRERSSDRKLYDDLMYRMDQLQRRNEDLEAELQAAVARARTAEGSKYALDNHLQERSTSRTMHDDLLYQIEQLQRRNRDLEEENMSLRTAQSFFDKERKFLSDQISILERSSLAPNGLQSGETDRSRDKIMERTSPARNGLQSREMDRSRDESLGRTAGLESKQHRMPEPLPAPPEELMYASSPPQGRAGSAHVHRHEASKHRCLAQGLDLESSCSKSAGPPEIEYFLMNRKMAMLDFTAELIRCENACWKENPQSATCSVSLNPGEEAKLGTVLKQDHSSHFGLHFHWIPRPAPQQRTGNDDKTLQSQDLLEERMRANGIVARTLGSAAAVVAKCKACGIDKFIDVEFLPNMKALFAKPNDPKNPTLVWRRPCEFLQSPVQLFDERCDPHPCDIQQGALGDCWFLASLAAMAEFPDLIKAVFSKSQVNDYGVYELLCYKNGEAQSVIIDDTFPCNPETGAPCYSHTKTNAIWVLLLEKAWAKLHGSYERIEGGLPYRAIMDLTGYTGTCIRLKDEDPEKLWARLARYDRLGYLMCAETPGEDHLTKAVTKPSAGIVPGHAYTLKAVREVEGQRLVNLRNPWGQFEWDGDWSDKSPLWTEEMRRACNYRGDANDGCFWMDIQDFLSHYCAVDVVYSCCSSGDKWIESRTHVDLSGDCINNKYIHFTVTRQTRGYFTLLQKDERIVNTHDYIELGFGVYGPLDSHDGIKEVVRSPCWNTREIVEEVADDQTMEPGKYAVVFFNPSRAHDRSFAMLLHLDSGQTQRREDFSTEVDDLSDSLWDDIALAIATKSANAQAQPMGPVLTSGNWLPNGGYALAAKSATGDKLSLVLDFSTCVGLQIPGGNASKVSRQLDGGDFQLIAQLLPSNSNGQRKLGFSISFSQ